MLVKLLKYDYKSFLRMILPIYALIVALSIFSKILMELPIDNTAYAAFSTLSVLLFYVVLIFSSAIIIFLVFVRFYKNYFTDEGYLMLTLPVKRWSLIISKLLTGLTVIVATYIVIFISLAINIGPKAIFTFLSEIIEVFCKFISSSGKVDITVIAFFILLFVAFIVIHIYYIMFGYTAISLGQIIIKDHKILGAVLSAIIIYFATQIINILLIVILVTVGNSLDISTNIDTWSTALTFGSVIFVTLFYLAYSTVFYFITNKILVKKINL